jgi:hypothetical protein
VNGYVGRVRHFMVITRCFIKLKHNNNCLLYTRYPEYMLSATSVVLQAQNAEKLWNSPGGVHNAPPDPCNRLEKGQHTPPARRLCTYSAFSARHRRLRLNSGLLYCHSAPRWPHIKNPGAATDSSYYSTLSRKSLELCMLLDDSV